ncbi:hypothetical protein [Leptolyngbya sp. FACHB-261]|uniref:hypothetical protein n=1 Tax=Leptolyngbya sp. FACHB-261 TaxID=2692806 RepID=UPI00168653EC|nr:hypothetical protein [Leptolyngbya sp. FACHB-261]MBD2104116.1 hypothetical protein [Leptolyngbya sp. FACHB-261]
MSRSDNNSTSTVSAPALLIAEPQQQPIQSTEAQPASPRLKAQALDHSPMGSLATQYPELGYRKVTASQSTVLWSGEVIGSVTYSSESQDWAINREFVLPEGSGLLYLLPSEHQAISVLLDQYKLSCVFQQFQSKPYISEDAEVFAEAGSEVEALDPWVEQAQLKEKAQKNKKNKHKHRGRGNKKR